MANLAGQFAGIVHLDVPPENVEALANALTALEPAGLRVVIGRSESTEPPAGRRIVNLELSGVDRPGIVRDLSASLAERGVSIEDLHTEIVNGATPSEHLFRVRALLFVPNALSSEALQQGLDALASEMKMDLALGDRHATSAARP